MSSLNPERPQSSVAGMEVIQRLAGHTNVILKIAWSPDGKWLASPSVDKTVRIWDVRTGVTVGTVHGHEHGVNQAAWSPDMELLATCSFDRSIRIWDGRSFRHIRTIRGHLDDVPSVAWSSDGSVLASASEDGTITLWDRHTWNPDIWTWGAGVLRVAAHPKLARVFLFVTATSVTIFGRENSERITRSVSHATSCAWSADGSNVAVASRSGQISIFRYAQAVTDTPVLLEGHVDTVTDVSFSGDGSLLASKSMDGTLRLWSTRTWQPVAILEEPASNFWPPGIAFHPFEQLLATLGSEDRIVRIWKIEPERLLASERPASFYSNAKVVLVGDSGVGKSGLSLVLTGQPFSPTESTHGRSVYTFDVVKKEEQGVEHFREILLWDLAGQPGYRLIHQLSLQEVAVALVVFDSRSETNPFAGIQHWCRALELAQHAQTRTTPGPIRKFLVAARSDRGGISVSRQRIEAVAAEFGFDGYFETSATAGLGITELAQAIREAVDWSAMPKASSNALFEDIKSFLVGEKASGSLLCSSDALYAAFLRAGGRAANEFREFQTCIGLVEARGLIRSLSFGNLVMLQPEMLDSYAAWVLEAAKSEPEGLGSIVESDVLNANFWMGGSRRASDPKVEVMLLHAVVEDLLRHEIALREHVMDETLLVFPSQFTRDWPVAPDPPGKTVIFRFEGPLQNIYATLAVRVARSGLFERAEMWRNAALFRRRGLGGNCGIYLRDVDEAVAELTLFFEKEASKETRYLFEEYVRSHLERRANPGTVQSTPIFICGTCAAEMNPKHVRQRLQAGHKSMACPVCDHTIVLLGEKEQQQAASGATLYGMHHAADTGRNEAAAASVIRAKEYVHEFDVFLSYNRDDGSAVEQIARDLRQRGLRPWLDVWEVEPGARWQDRLDEQIEHIRTAAVFFGPAGEGKTQRLEREGLIGELVTRDLKLIPVVLSGVTGTPDVPRLLRGHNWVDFRVEAPDPMELLFWGITGQKGSREP